MTQVDDDIKYGMIEAISHLIHRDYEAIVEDFVTLQFIPRGTDLRPILPVLANVFDQALEGGGAKNINFQELAADLAEITFEYPFRIPPCVPATRVAHCLSVSATCTQHCNTAALLSRCNTGTWLSRWCARWWSMGQGQAMLPACRVQ
jgi:predicted unusual protein kinase regulating ubiquinone biosynthesis (AarF/ABC1/UbiB family)